MAPQMALATLPALRQKDRSGPDGRRSAMDMHHIRHFLAVTETLNFTRAAERCHVTQPAFIRVILV
jgi:hypothetical protein